MTHFNTGNHHHLLKKRLRLKFEEYPHPNKWKDLLDRIMYPASLIGPLMMIPQIAKIYVEKDASSIAISSWVFFGLVSAMWILYGLAHKEKVLVVANASWILSYILIVTGAIIY